MSQVAREHAFVRFGVYELDLRSGELRKAGLRVKIQDLPLKVLAALLEHPGEVVTREDLRKRIWKDDTFGDFDHAVNVAIAKLRTALGDSADSPHIIETLPRRGYRFIASLKAGTSEVTAGETTEILPPTRAGSRSIAWRRWLLPASLGVTLIIVFLSYLGTRKPHKSATNIRSVAVLPLSNLSGDPGQDYFADGMTEELITSLAKIRSLRVTSRTSTMCYRNTHLSIPEIAQTLQVDALLEGAVVRSGDKVRITAQLIDARTDRHLWAKEYNRDIRDVLSLQGDVARDIAQEISATLTPDERSRLTDARQLNVEAFEAYLKGRYYWNKRTAQGIKKASDYFQQAIEKDPTYGLAYSGLADCNSGLAWHGFISPAEALPKAKAAALKAIEIGPQSGEAHASLALVLHHQGDWAKAETEFKRAIELSPRYANAHHWYGDYLSVMGRHDEALAEAKRAFELDPLAPIINTWLGLRYYLARRYDEAIAQGRKIVEFDPSFAPGHLLLGQAYVLKGMKEEAISELQEGTRLSGDSTLYMAQVGVAYAAAGRKAEALSVIDHLQKEATRSYVSPYGLAQIYAALGNKPQALKWLQTAYAEHAVWMAYLGVDPILDPLRHEPGFQDLIRRLGLS
jgi:TolB-like protein/DNA-binding winged helix-turn-helix (wHTH) protein/cytochrome c-type biogenesis protein CcmH/NrfG